MKCVRVGAAALNQTPLAWDENVNNILEVIQEAKKQRVSLLCLPELCITGYGCEDHFLSKDVQQWAFEYLIKITRETFGITVCVGLPVMYRNALYNTIAVIHDQKVLGLTAKQHLAGDGLHYEPRWFKPWPANRRGVVKFYTGAESGFEIPIGDLQYDLRGVRLGFEICEDAWVAERPGSHLARKGVDIILNPSASHFAFGKHEIRKRFVIEGSRAFAATYVYANLLGNEAGRTIYDGGCLIASGGQLVAESPRLSFRSHTLLTATVDIDATRTQQMATASFVPEFENDDGWVEDLVGIDQEGFTPTSSPSPEEPMSKYREFVDAQSLALFDYLRKSRMRGFVVSLSGGADSAACAVLVDRMISKGIQELGKDFCARANLADLPHEVLNRKLLTCVYQATKNSSKTTLEAAKAVAEGVKAKFHVVDVDEIVKVYTSLVSVAVQHDFSWDKDDLTLQNIQARVRAPSVWMIANLENKLLLTTSNRSEAAVGYCTMDGDTAGSLAPLGGIDKAFLIEWLKYMCLIEGHTYLNAVIAQRPTAELRPGESQTDESDLMPYEILEFIEDRAILEKKGPRDVFLCLKAAYASTGYNTFASSNARLFGYVQKFFRLWCRNQWKRERYALSFHVDNKNLDPRSWCRFPVLSGGFEAELTELREELGL